MAVLDDPVDSVRFVKAVLAPDILERAARADLARVREPFAAAASAAVMVLHRGFKAPAHEAIAKVLERLALHLPRPTCRSCSKTFGGPIERALDGSRRRCERAVPHYARLDRLADDDLGRGGQAWSGRSCRHGAGGARSRHRADHLADRRLSDRATGPTRSRPSVADVTGAARIIYYGPYFHLPPGTYKVRLIVAFSAQARGTPFRLTVYSNHKPLTKVFMTIRPTAVPSSAPSRSSTSAPCSM